MRKIKNVLRLKFQLHLSDRQIARSCALARSTVAEYVRRAQRAGLSWPLPEGWDDRTITHRLFPPTGKSPPTPRPLPDFATVHEERCRHKHVTLMLLWDEYKQGYPEGYQYSQFCDLYPRWRRQLDLVLRQEHRAGEKLFVDYAGDTVPIVDRHTGKTQDAWIFVAVLGASNYTYAEASLRQDLPSWLAAHTRALEFLGGCPRVVVPDNTKDAVHRPCRYEPDLNASYAAWAAHYGVAVIPARVRSPRDKAKVESGVLVVERWILAALRHRTFFSLGELNEAIAELLVRLNSRTFRKLPGNRRQRFEDLDRPALGPLPSQRYVFAQWKKTRVNIDYHIEFDRHYYSVPYVLVGQKVELRTTVTTVEIFHQGRRVASHRRSYEPGKATTLPEHRPECHRRYLEWSPSRLIHWAQKVGPHTAAVVEKILQSRRYPEQSYRSCLGILRLGSTFGEERLERACRRALRLQACSYKSIQSILKTGLDREAEPSGLPKRPPIEHANVRGAEYFEGEKGASHVG